MKYRKFEIGDKVRIVKNTGSVKIKDRYIGQIMIIGQTDHSSSFPYVFEPDIGWAWAEDDLELVIDDKIVITHDGKTTTATMYHGDKKTVATARCAPEDTFDFKIGAKLAMERLMATVYPVTYGGFKVGDRVNYHGVNGTVICIDKEISGVNDNALGVEFDQKVGIHHDCEGVELAAGKTGTKNTSRWMRPTELTHGEVIAPKYYNGKVVCTERNIGNIDYYTVGKIYEFVDGKMTADNGHKLPSYEPIYSFRDWERYSSCKWIEIKE